MNLWCDRIVTGGILFLILFTPFAFGSVHPWAFAMMEALIFLLVVVWMAKILYVSKEQEAGSEEQRAGSQEHGAGSREQRMGSTEEGARSKGQGAFRLPTSDFRLPSFVFPLVLFIGFALFQLLPLPPSLLRMISPATYELYTQSLPGWPARMPYGDLLAQSPTPDRHDAAPRSVILPTPEEVRNGAPVPFSNASASPLAPSAPSSLPHAPRSLLPETWFSLSIAPALTRTDLLKFAAYAALFFLVLLYPFSENHQRSAISNQHSAFSSQRPEVSGRRSEVGDQPSIGISSSADARFFRSVLLVVLLAGFVVAAIGFAQRFSWNGKILWFFAPYDWAAPATGEVHRASGPFVNPGHFANYLSLILPLSLACAIFRLPFIHERLRVPLRISGAFTALLLFTGIVMSLSRGAWISALLGVSILLWFSPWRIENGKPELARNQRSEVRNLLIRTWLQKRGAFVAGSSLIILCFLLIVSLFFIGPSGREQVEARLGETVTEDAGLGGRAAVWLDTLGMVRDFSLFGVGLGSWPELFPRYRRAPWSADFYREAHNDYLELLAETGIVGIGLLGWFFFQTGRALLRGLKRVSSHAFPLMAAICASLGVMAFHELMDFSLQIPANAFLFTLLMALGLRMAGQPVRGQQSEASSQRPEVRGQWSPVTAPAMALGSLGLFFLAVNQQQIPYPYYLFQPRSVAEAKELLLNHPANALARISLMRLWESKAPLATQHSLVAASLWLEPTNPHIRDLYASTLLRMGKTTEGLNQITHSISDSPSLSSHYYLTDKFLPWLSTEEQIAVEEGFKQALARSYPGTLESFAAFYARFGRFSDQAGLFEDAAPIERDTARKVELLLKAGIAYATADEGKKAERVLSRAIAASPRDSRAYQHLMTSIHGPKKDLAKAREIITSGINAGASPLPLYLSLAQAAAKAENLEERAAAFEEAKAVIEKAVKEGQDPYPLYLSLADGASQARARQEEKAALLAALDLRPRSADILFRVADLYLHESDFDHAALIYRKLARITPEAAEVHFRLAVAEEGRYRFAAAENAYARAVELAPQSENYRQRYESFKARLEQSRR